MNEAARSQSGRLFLVRKPRVATDNQVETPERRGRVDLIVGNFLELVPGVIFVVVALGLVVEALDEGAASRHKSEIRPQVPDAAEVLQPLVEAA